MRQLRVGNCSGFYGDRLTAMREMLEGGELDVLTGDYLAELTMLILGRDQLKDPSLGYARTFVRQVEDCLGLALERGREDRRPTPAGSTRPAWPPGSREIAAGSGLSPSDRLRRRRRRAARSASPGRADRQRLPRRLRHRRRAPRQAPTSWSPAASPTPRSSSVRRSRTSAGTPRRTTSWPAPWSPVTSSSAARRPPAATSPASGAARQRPPQPLGFPVAEIGRRTVRR